MSIPAMRLPRYAVRMTAELGCEDSHDPIEGYEARHYG